jgi:TPR repeat protein
MSTFHFVFDKRENNENQPNIITNNNHSSEYYKLALIHKNDDAKLATYYYEKSWTEDRYIPAIFALSKCYEEGNGVLKNLKKAQELKTQGRLEVANVRRKSGLL